jgi:hypothetical protein
MTEHQDEQRERRATVLNDARVDAELVGDELTKRELIEALKQLKFTAAESRRVLRRMQARHKQQSRLRQPERK